MDRLPRMRNTMNRLLRITAIIETGTGGEEQVLTHSKQRVGLTAHAIIAICLVVVAAVATPPVAWGAGLMLYEQGTSGCWPRVGRPGRSGAGCRDGFYEPCRYDAAQGFATADRNRTELWQLHFQSQCEN